MGLDLGFTYHLKENVSLLGSALDIGFITYSKDITTYKLKGDVEINNIGLIDPSTGETLDYWDVIGDDIYPQIPIDTLQSTYVSFRSPKINIALQYRFGKHYRQVACSTSSYSRHRTYQNEMGVHIYTIFRPKQPQLTTTLYYSRSLTNFLKAKITYTVDSHSFSNIGLGFSTQINKFNIYASTDNILSYNDIYNSKKIAVLFGMNLIFDE